MHPLSEKKCTFDVVGLDGEFLQVGVEESGPLRGEFLPLSFDFLSTQW
jgi:hypothetical protein